MILSPTTAKGKTYRLIQISTPVILRWIEPLNLESDPDLANINRDPDPIDRQNAAGKVPWLATKHT
jgi:hypothetical protein